MNNKGSYHGEFSNMKTDVNTNLTDTQEIWLQGWHVMACSWTWRSFLNNDEDFVIPDEGNNFSSYAEGIENHHVCLNAGLPIQTHLKKTLQILLNKFSLLPNSGLSFIKWLKVA